MPQNRLRRKAAIVLAILSSAATAADWNNFYSIDELRLCAEPMLLTFATFNPIDDPDIQIKIRACTAGNTTTSTKALTATSVPEPLYTSKSATASASNDSHIQKRQDNRVVDEDDEHPLPLCRASNSVNTTARWISGKTEKISTAADVPAEDGIIGAIRNIQEFLRNPINCDEAVVYGYSQGVLVGLHAGSDIANRELAVGFVDRIVDRLLDDSQSDNGLGRLIVQVCGDDSNSLNQHVGLAIDSTGDFAWVQGALRSWSEARCVIDLGSQSLVEDDKWPIEIPIIRRKSSGISKRAPPTPRPDGTCVSYVVQNQDTCSAIAIKYDIKEDDLYKYNEQTYGWGGCTLLPGQRICVGPGTPRMPAENPDAECGPTKPGTKAPTGSQKIEDLSPCPLKACCNIWGKCGIDSDFCVPTESTTGNPGTAQPNTNGCVQNCGMELETGSPPAQFMKVGYYEAWNHQRPCLHMTPKQIPSSYTHIHFSFAEITPSFGVSLGKLSDVFEEFKGLSGFKRIVAFGGWALSTEPATYQLFPNAVKPANRATFAQACVDFVLTHGLDGVDFDWEYPAQPDIPGIPPGDPQEAEDYLEFIKLVREKMPGDKTVSIAAPASYWYLKQFLIAEMSEHLDYIIYMTYDLHGQWDFGSKWAQPGCPAGNCLRSHVNMTETMSSLAMVTKAGVPSAKIVVGVSSYGRSFKMTDASCSGPFCTYTGKESGAAKGKCTGTGGYISNGEINEIIAEGRAKKQWTDETESDYLVYDDGEWVAYMDDANKQARIAKYRSLNFGGSTDWAVDLQGEPGAYNGEVVYLDPKIYDITPAQCSPPCLFVFPPSALPSATTITIPAYTTSIVLQGGFTKTITVNPPQLTLSSMSFSNVNVTSGSTTGTIRPSGSVDLPRITTVIDGESRTIQLPPWPAITNGPPSNWTTRPPTSDEPLIPITETPEDEDDWIQPEEPKPPFTEVPFDDWPDMELVPVPTPVPDEGEDDDNGKHKSSCRLWFFFVRKIRSHPVAC
ncbi:killer toxin subunits alpha/beta [Colletotrichum liriopes]|uniref:chitinase n=1 Tax=Colletotrichum liriopes TaxID=708192 RepID=A0AA37GTP7_9PEZI|nr:killer toxin subunits alpha/beta [Colletotrichum liriopes]